MSSKRLIELHRPSCNTATGHPEVASGSEQKGSGTASTSEHVHSDYQIQFFVTLYCFCLASVAVPIHPNIERRSTSSVSIVGEVLLFSWHPHAEQCRARIEGSGVLMSKCCWLLFERHAARARDHMQTRRDGRRRRVCDGNRAGFISRKQNQNSFQYIYIIKWSLCSTSYKSVRNLTYQGHSVGGLGYHVRHQQGKYSLWQQDSDTCNRQCVTRRSDLWPVPRHREGAPALLPSLLSKYPAHSRYDSKRKCLRHLAGHALPPKKHTALRPPSPAALKHFFFDRNVKKNKIYITE